MMTKAARTRPCPICGKPADAKLNPFCSPRCADVDLNRWLAGVYAVPAEEREDAEEPPPGARDTARNGDP